MKVKKRQLRPSFITLFLSITPLLFLLKPVDAQKRSDSIKVAISPAYDSVSGLHRLLFGEGYRKLWAARVPTKIFDLKKEKGGLTIIGRGGGNQTNSLRLKDAKGKEYVLRSIQKYPEKGLPQKLRKTVARDILQDQVVTAHPFSAITVPPMAEALGLAHSTPEIVFLPDTEALDTFRKDFGNTVLLFEEREPVTLETNSTEKVQRKVEDDNDFSIDQQLVLRARLLDFVLGDWDRHEDQWRWEVQKKDDKTLYAPIPRDRDKVYYTTTGVFPWILSHQWLKANLQNFEENISDIDVYNYNNRYFDRYFLNKLSIEQWTNEIDFVKSKLTDNVIAASIQLLPDTIYQLSGKRIIDVLKQRRNNLNKFGLKYYRFLANHPDIPGTTNNEQVLIDYKANKTVEVVITNIKKDSSLGKEFYRRVFSPKETNEIRLYGLDGKDKWIVTGNGTSPIKTRVIGGADIDTYTALNTAQKQKVYLYDSKGADRNIFQVEPGVHLKLANDSNIHAFDRKNFVYNQRRMTGSAFFNPDQGFLLRAGYIIETQGFRKTPYASKHLFYINYATLWKSIMLTYNGSFKQALGKNDLNIDFVSRGPYNIDNFYGLGNEVVLKDRSKATRKFFQNRYDIVKLDVSLQRSISSYSKLRIGPAAEFYTSSAEDNFNKFLLNYNFRNPQEKVFSNQFFAGGTAGLHINTKEETIMPGKGIEFRTDLRAMQQINGDKRWYMSLFSSFDFYIPIKNSSIVIANRVAAGTTFGNPFFYQQHRLGGPLNLRGFTVNQFTGKSVIYNNVELRLKLFDFTSYISPGSFGVIGFNDIGRVWIPNEKSNRWHSGSGGGIYIIPADLIVIQGLVAVSDQGTFPYFSVGFRF